MAADQPLFVVTITYYYLHQIHKPSKHSHNFEEKFARHRHHRKKRARSFKKQRRRRRLVHGDVDGALASDLVDAVLRLLLLGPGQLGGVRGLLRLTSAGAAAFAVAVEAVAVGAAARPRGALALRRGVGRLHGGRRRRRLPPAQLRRLGPGRGQLLEFGLRGRRRLVVEAWHGVGLEGQALPKLLQSLLLLFLQIQKCMNKQ